MLTSFQVKSNITSTVIPLSWVIYTVGGHGPLTFAIYVRAENSVYQLWRDNITQVGEEGDTMFVDVYGDVQPETQYVIRIVAENQRQGGNPFSEPLETSGTTRGKSVIKSTSKLVVYLFRVLCCFKHCTGHITMGSWKGRGNQYI